MAHCGVCSAPLSGVKRGGSPKKLISTPRSQSGRRALLGVGRSSTDLPAPDGTRHRPGVPPRARWHARTGMETVHLGTAVRWARRPAQGQCLCPHRCSAQSPPSTHDSASRGSRLKLCLGFRLELWGRLSLCFIVCRGKAETCSGLITTRQSPPSRTNSWVLSSRSTPDALVTVNAASTLAEAPSISVGENGRTRGGTYI